MELTSSAFKTNARDALVDPRLQKALRNVPAGFQTKRAKARAGLPEFDQMRDRGRDVKNHVLENLDLYLERFEQKVTEAGGQVHWCATAEDARRVILEICERRGARRVTKGKSMITEEIGLNDHLIENGITPVETDLGEYIIQLRQEPPSHIIAPAIHLNKEDVAEAFYSHHTDLPADRDLSEAPSLVTEARMKLRQAFLSAEVGITGANFLVAETGSTLIVTNEGNGDLTQNLPPVHIAVSSIEKIVPTLEDVSLMLRLLARSATGQEFSVYTTFSTGTKRADDISGPEEFHVVLLDNGRSKLLGSEFQEVLRCIRCGACMNHCPVYGAVGGHAYGWVYPGPIGAVITPALVGVDKAGHLPNASTFCGRCEAVCPMHIPLPKMMRHWREKEFEAKLQPAFARRALGLWAALVKRPRLYRAVTALGSFGMRLMGGRSRRLGWLPLAGGWTRHRDLPVPTGGTFMAQYRRRQQLQAGDLQTTDGGAGA